MIDLFTLVKWLAVLAVCMLIIGAVSQGLSLLDDLDVAFSGSVDAEGAGALRNETTAGEFIAQFAEVLYVDGGIFGWLTKVSVFIVSCALAYTTVRWVARIFG